MGELEGLAGYKEERYYWGLSGSAGSCNVALSYKGSDQQGGQGIGSAGTEQQCLDYNLNIILVAKEPRRDAYKLVVAGT